jgi:hypothetical protein
MPSPTAATVPPSTTEAPTASAETEPSSASGLVTADLIEDLRIKEAEGRKWFPATACDCQTHFCVK